MKILTLHLTPDKFVSKYHLDLLTTYFRKERIFGDKTFKVIETIWDTMIFRLMQVRQYQFA